MAGQHGANSASNVQDIMSFVDRGAPAVDGAEAAVLHCWGIERWSVKVFLNQHCWDWHSISGPAVTLDISCVPFGMPTCMRAAFIFTVLKLQMVRLSITSRSKVVAIFSSTRSAPVFCCLVAGSQVTHDLCSHRLQRMS